MTNKVFATDSSEQGQSNIQASVKDEPSHDETLPTWEHLTKEDQQSIIDALCLLRIWKDEMSKK